MADVVQELVIALGLDSSNLMGGIDKAVAAVGDAVGSTTAKTSAASKMTVNSFRMNFFMGSTFLRQGASICLFQ